VIFGANLGTTSIGWIVSLLGFKLNITALAFPLVAVGALMRLLCRGRTSQLGVALAGFGLIFVGIAILQDGMEGLGDWIDPARFPDGTLTARLLLVLIGAAMTVIMQSSSAAVATTLTALFTGTINMDQAAALVIGQNIGTTVKVVLVSIGASVPVKRTAVAHVVFNLATGLVALLFMPLFLTMMVAIVGMQDNGTVAIAAFHTFFNVLGVALFLPWIDHFSRIIERLVPEKRTSLTRHLDPSVAQLGPVAVEAARRTVLAVAQRTLEVAREVVGEKTSDAMIGRKLEDIQQALDEIQRFLESIRTPSLSGQQYQDHVSTLHAMDHLARMVEDCRDRQVARRCGRDPQLQPSLARLRAVQKQALQWLGNPESPFPLPHVHETWQEIADMRRQQRPVILETIASGQTRPTEALARLEAIHWMDRIAYHTWRTIAHLAGAQHPGNETPVNEGTAVQGRD